MAMGNEGVHDSQIRVDDLDVMYMVRKFWNSYNIAPSIQHFFCYQIPEIKWSRRNKNMNLPNS